MSNFLNKVIMYAEVLVGILLFYLGATTVLPYFIINLGLIVTGFLVFSDGLGKVDKSNGHGQSTPPDSNPKKPSNPFNFNRKSSDSTSEEGDLDA